jgi:hypothetical protein
LEEEDKENKQITGQEDKENKQITGQLLHYSLM